MKPFYWIARFFYDNRCQSLSNEKIKRSFKFKFLLFIVLTKTKVYLRPGSNVELHMCRI